MIDHIGFEVSDLRKAANFYDAVFYALGARRMLASEQAVAYGFGHRSKELHPGLIRRGAQGFCDSSELLARLLRLGRTFYGLIQLLES